MFLVVCKHITVEHTYMAAGYMAKYAYMAGYLRFNFFFKLLKLARIYGGNAYMAAKVLGQTSAI